MDLICDTEIECPFCGETTFLQVDTSEGDQVLIEDCTVCCCPIQIDLRCHPGEIIHIAVVES